MDKRCEVYRRDSLEIQELFEAKYSNWSVCDASRSKWSLKNDIQTMIQNTRKRRQMYLDLKTKGKAAPVFGIGLSNEYLKTNKSSFLEYCPVALVDDGEIRKSNDPNRHMVAYQDQLYCLCTERHKDIFLSDPEKYIKGKLPASLPERRSKEEIKALFPMQLELRGYCPVTFQEGPSG